MGKIHNLYAGWNVDKPIVDCIAPDGDFNAVTGALPSAWAMFLHGCAHFMY